MKIVFAGTPVFAATALSALLDARRNSVFTIVGIYTQPDRPAGRGQKLTASAVKQLASAHAIPVFQPENLRAPDAQAALAALHPDLMIVAAYGLILPQKVLDIPTLGCLNIHGSLLPRWRGAAPIHRAIEAGDAETGVGIMRMEAGLDTGAVLYELRTPILESDTTGSVHDRLAALGARAIVHVVTEMTRGVRFAETSQPSEGITYAHKIAPEESKIDWNLPTAQLSRKVRAFNPNPGCSAMLGEDSVKIWAVTPRFDLRGAPGTVLTADKGQLVVATADGALMIDVLQRPGKSRVTAAQYLSGTSLSR